MLDLLKGTDIEKDLISLEDILQGAIQDEEPLLSRMSGHILFSEGLRLRPSFGIAVYKACWGKNVAELLPVTAALELIHTANLIHADLIYKAPTHRGAPSLHMMFGKNEAIVTADFLFAKANLLCASYGPDIIQMTMRTCIRMAEGEVLQMSTTLKDTTVDKYMEMVKRRTADIISTTAKLGAWIARAPVHTLESMEVMGQHLGLAYQLVDDFLDIGGSICVAEPKGTEVLQGRVTMPIIRARDQLNDKARKQLMDIYRKRKRDKADVKRVMKLVSSTDGLEFTKKKAEALVEAAIKEAVRLEDGIHRRMLMELSRYVVERCV